MPEVETKDKRIVFRADQSFIDKAKAAAKKDGMALSVWIRYKLQPFVK